LSDGSDTLNTILLQVKDSTVPEIVKPPRLKFKVDPVKVQVVENGSVGGSQEIAPSLLVSVPFPKTKRSSFSQASKVAYSSSTGAFASAW
jgi:hypothetical protein